MGGAEGETADESDFFRAGSTRRWPAATTGLGTKRGDEDVEDDAAASARGEDAADDAAAPARGEPGGLAKTSPSCLLALSAAF
jgi:hypothetical protein